MQWSIKSLGMKILPVVIALAIIFSMLPKEILLVSAVENKVSVTISYSNGGEYSYGFVPQSIDVTDDLAESYGYSDLDGNVSLLDAIIAMHMLAYGDDFTEYFSLSGSSVNKIMGVEGINKIFVVNGEARETSVPDTAIANGDVIELFDLQNDLGIDAYTWFEHEGNKISEIAITTGESVDLSLIGISSFAWGEWGAQPPAPIADASAVSMRYEENNGYATAYMDQELEIVTNSNGNFTLKFDSEGVYYLTVSGYDESGVEITLPWLSVKVIDVNNNGESSKESIKEESIAEESSMEESSREENNIKPVDYDKVLVNVLNYIRAQVPAPQVSSIGGEWTILALVRGGKSDEALNKSYLNTLEKFILNNAYAVDPVSGKVALHRAKITENERVIITLNALGLDAGNFKGYNLVELLCDKDDSGNYKLSTQGVNGVAYALIALNSGNLLQNDEGTALREWCVDYLLGHQKASGGWSLDGSVEGEADPDTTSMGLQALAFNFGDSSSYNYDQIKIAVEKAVQALRNMKISGGLYDGENGSVAAESLAQMVIALTALNYDGTDDGSFLVSAAENLLTYYDEATGGFRHIPKGSVDLMASEQAACALVAYDRYIKEQKAFYEMADTEEYAATESGTDKSSNVKDENPDTGDNMNISLWVLVLLCPTIVLLIVSRCRKSEVGD